MRLKKRGETHEFLNCLISHTFIFNCTKLNGSHHAYK